MTATLRLNIARSIAILIFIAASATLIHPVLAQDAAATPKPTRKPTVKQKVEAKKEVISTKLSEVREKIASREAALKTKLQDFKDQRKAAVVERVNTNLNRINQNQTTQMAKHLENMSAILAKLETRVTSGSPDVKDPVAAKAAIADSRAAISTATTAVTAQSEKDYTITVTSETLVKTDAQKMRDLLKTDITAVRKLVIDAKQSVADAISIAKSGSKEATASGQQ